MKHNYHQINSEVSSKLDYEKPASPLSAEVFMDHIEENTHSHPLPQKFLYWYGYVDDFLACFSSMDGRIQTLLALLTQYTRR